MMMPENIIDWLEQDVHQLIWAKDPHFAADEHGQDADSMAKRKIKHATALKAWRTGGIGQLDWREHLKSLRRKWYLRYLDQDRGAWKWVLDEWICKGHTLGRGVVLGSGDLPEAPNLF